MKTLKTSNGTELPLLNLKGKDYLPVAQRLVWFREERPMWGIETSFLKIEDDYAIARAEVRNENGRVIATAHKREDAKHFPDFMEKAETGAIGRALAEVGYGTQFAPELDEEHRIVDTPQPSRSKLAALPSASANPGAYVMPIGKNKGKRLEDIEVSQLGSWLDYMKKSVTESSDSPAPATIAAMQAVESFLQGRERPAQAR